MSDDAAIYGKSYWEIVVHAFRKNWAARIALWVSTLMIVTAILAPLLANDRPIFFTGTMPGAYQRAYSAATRGAFMAVLTLPARLKAETAKFDKKTASLNDYLKRLTDEEAAAQYDFINRLRKRAESRPDTRAPWISRDVPIADVEAELKEEQEETPGAIAALKKELAGADLTEEQRTKKAARLRELEGVLASIPRELAQLEASRQRIIRDMPAVYGQLLTDGMQGLRFKVREMADQLDASKRAMAEAILAEFDKAVGSDYLVTTEDRKPALRSALDRLKAELDPEKQTLVPRTRWPLIESLNALDVLFISGLFCTLLAFGPLTWLGLKRIQPLERRWVITWALGVTPAIVLAGLWLVLHESRFDTVHYKSALAPKTDGGPPAAEKPEPPAVVMTASFWPPIRWRYDEVPDLTIAGDQDRPPTPPSWEHPFGTDFVGRDLLARMIWGSRVSLSIGFVAEAIALFIGVVLGALAGYYRGWVDIVISRIIEIVICFPTFFLILAVVAFLPPSIYYVMLVLGLFGWMGIARLQRGEFLRLVNLDFVQSAIALGASKPRVMFRHLLPNALAPVLVAASFGIAGAMLTESGLSFLGFGVQEPETSWGQILYTGRTQLGKWWTFTIPGAAIFVAVTCYNLVGDGIRDAVDPRLKT